MTPRRHWREVVLGAAVLAVPAAMAIDMARRPAVVADKAATSAPRTTPGATSRGKTAEAMPPGFAALPGARLVEATDDGAGGRQARFVTDMAADALRDRLVADMTRAGLRLDGVVATDAMTMIAGARDGPGPAGAPYAVQAMLTPTRDGTEVLLSWTSGDPPALAPEPEPEPAPAPLRALVPPAARR